MARYTASLMMTIEASNEEEALDVFLERIESKDFDKDNLDVSEE